MVDRALSMQRQSYGLTTAEIHYHMPDHPALLQLYVWQEYDLAPRFPALQNFLKHWTETLDGLLHSVRVAHKGIVAPAKWNALEGVITVH